MNIHKGQNGEKKVDYYVIILYVKLYNLKINCDKIYTIS